MVVWSQPFRYFSSISNYSSVVYRSWKKVGYAGLAIALSSFSILKQSEIQFILNDRVIRHFEGASHVCSLSAETVQVSSAEKELPDPILDESVGFKQRKIMEYEDRIRHYSKPDKIFRYFASYKVMNHKGHGEVMMTPEDFLRSITPGQFQPQDVGLDKYHVVSVDDMRKIRRKQQSVNNASSSPGLLEEDSVFNKIFSSGMISFSDYLFLVTVMSTSRRHFEIAFRMFDLNGDGTLDVKEFEAVTHRAKKSGDVSNSNSSSPSSPTSPPASSHTSALKTYFFGQNMKGTLTVAQFLDFQKSLQNEILSLEFRRKAESGGSTFKKFGGERISERDFADLLIAYAGFSNSKKSKLLKKVTKKFKDETSVGITLSEYVNFFQLLYSMNDVDAALTFYKIAGASIDAATLRHAAKTVATLNISEHVTDVVFTLFDDTDSVTDNSDEFIRVMRRRVMRGLERPKDMGFYRFIESVALCSRRHIDEHVMPYMSHLAKVKPVLD